DIALARDRADNGHLICATRNVLPFVPMAILVLASKVRLVYFNDTHQLLKLRIGKTSTQPMANVPSRLVRPCPNHSMDLKRRHALLAREHVVQHLEPRPKRVIGVLENRPYIKRKPINRFMLLADPVVRAGL